MATQRRGTTQPEAAGKASQRKWHWVNGSEPDEGVERMGFLNKANRKLQMQRLRVERAKDLCESVEQGLALWEGKHRKWSSSARADNEGPIWGATKGYERAYDMMEAAFEEVASGKVDLKEENGVEGGA